MPKRGLELATGGRGARRSSSGYTWEMWDMWARSISGYHMLSMADGQGKAWPTMPTVLQFEDFWLDIFLLFEVMI